MDASGRIGVARAAEGHPAVPRSLFEEVEPEWVEVDLKRVRVEKTVDFGGPWLGVQLMRRLGLDRFFSDHLAAGKEQVPWSVMVHVLVLCRLCHPSSELHIAEHYFEHTALADLLGIPAELVNDDRLYRALDQLLPHKEALQRHLKERAGSLFGLDYELFLYDITSTYFEGEAEANPLAKRGYSIGVIERRIGRLLGQNSRAAKLFEVQVRTDKTGRTQVVWHKREPWRDWARLSEGRYLLRTNVQDWSAEDLWKAYIQLTEAEDAFRIQKSDLVIRPIWHQKEDRVRAHILVCFLAYVLWKTLGGFCRQAGLGDRGFISKDKKQELAQRPGIDLQTPVRKNMAEHRSIWFLKWISRMRRLVETVASQLVGRFHIQTIRVRDVWHFQSRLIRKILSHTIAVFLNTKLGRDPLDLDSLITL